MQVHTIEDYKNAGAFYTPMPLVTLVCDRVLGPLLEHQTPASVGTVRILDPACGAGAFLVGAFEYLLRWHTRWYRAHRSAVLAPGSALRTQVVVGDDGTILPSQGTRTRLLRDCIHGIDIDPGAIEAARLSLALTLLQHT